MASEPHLHLCPDPDGERGTRRAPDETARSATGGPDRASIGRDARANRPRRHAGRRPGTRRRTGPDPAGRLGPDALAALVELLLDDPGPLESPELVRLTTDPDRPDGLAVATRPTPDGCHPIDALVGIVADDDWLAIGVRARGRAYPLDGGRATPVRAAHLVAADGSWASAWTDPDGSRTGSPARGLAGDPDLPSGRVDDACRRVFGLPTAPPPTTTADLWSQLWLDAVVATGSTAAGRRRLRSWRAVADLHPAAGAPSAGLWSWDRRRGPAPDQLAAAAAELTASISWTVLRSATATREWDAPGVDPLTAAWLDDGAFARWVLGSLPDLPDLVDAAAALLPDPVRAGIAQTLGIEGVE